MPWVFNPFTGKLDQTGSGGSATTDASLLTSGTLADARLSSNVLLLTGAQSITGNKSFDAGTLTASQPLAITQTWNNSGVTFSGMRVNVTDTASNASSLLADFQVGGVTQSSISKDGVVRCRYIQGTQNTIAIQSLGGAAFTGGYNQTAQIYSDNFYLGVNSDVRLFKDGAANTLALRNGTNANTFRVYGTYTDASNGRRLDITSTTGGIFTLTATGNGTGASGNLLKLTQPILLPASSVTLATNGDLAFEATSNTSLTIKYRGSDGTTRSAAITLA